MILQEEMTILSNVKIAPRVFRMVLQGEMVLDMKVPDQFLHIRVPSPDKVLRRPISISEYDREAKTCVIIYRVEGPGLADVSQMTPGQKLDVMGPLGNGFDLSMPFPKQKALIIGGGIAEHMAQFQPYLHTKALVLPARSLNQAGIIGAALFAESQI